MPLRVAIVGCGKIADAHAAQIRRIEGAEIVGVCDRERLMAGQLAERFGVGGVYDDVAALLEQARPDVVHVTTPPHSHFELARQCLEHGCHVYVEKPFTLDAREAERLIDLARRRQLQLTVGHDAQFSHASRRLRDWVRQGYVGDRIVHLESYYGYDFSDPSYARGFLQDTDHWVRQLPGGLLQNVISHGIARIAEFLGDDLTQVIVQGFVSPRLQGLGESNVLDELRVLIVDGSRTTAYFTFSSQIRPILHQFRVFGSRNGLVLDERQQTVVKLRGAPFKSYAEHFVPPVIFAKQYLAEAARNARLFIRRDFHMDGGKKELFATFYAAIRGDAPPPVPFREILLTAKLMDAIVGQLGTSSAPVPVQPEVAHAG